MKKTNERSPARPRTKIADLPTSKIDQLVSLEAFELDHVAGGGGCSAPNTCGNNGCDDDVMVR